MDERPALELTGLSKAFGGVRALSNASLSVRAGEIHGLVGQNGSGKSTLIKVLAGYHLPDAGRLRVRGEEVHLPLRAGDYRRLGMAFVHQDLGLVPSLSVLENLRLEELAASSTWHLAWREEHRRARDVLARYGVEIDTRAQVAEIAPLDRALLAVVRAVESVRHLHGGDGILILDEPTVLLPESATRSLLALVRQVAESGSAVVFVTHYLDELSEVTDRVTVLRDGRTVATVRTREVSSGELAQLIVGRPLAERADVDRSPVRRGEGLLVRDLAGRRVAEATFATAPGEILGITGLPGSGFDDVPYLLFGARDATAGTLTLGGRTEALAGMTPARALARGLALIPADRHGEGGIDSLPALENTTLHMLSEYSRFGVLRRKRMRRDCQDLIAEFNVRPGDPFLDFAAFSGGNQQKLLLAKWLRLRPAVLLAHEPTQGVDVGARADILSAIEARAAAGLTVLYVGLDHEELELACHRVLVFARGRVVEELTGAEVTAERMSDACYRTDHEVLKAAG